MQNYFYFYAAFAGLALLVHLIVNWHQLANWRNLEVRRGKAEACGFTGPLLKPVTFEKIRSLFSAAGRDGRGQV